MYRVWASVLILRLQGLGRVSYYCGFTNTANLSSVGIVSLFSKPTDAEIVVPHGGLHACLQKSSCPEDVDFKASS